MLKPITQKFEFQSPQGHTLAGRLDLPLVGKPVAYAVFAHCFSCSKDFAASRNIAVRLAAEGIATLRFDFTGLGHSQGEFANSHFRANVEDLVTAIQAMGEAGMAPSLLVGHSLGGAAVLQATAKLEQIKAVAVIGAPYDPQHSTARLNGDLDAIRANGQGEVEIAGRAFTITAEFLDSMKPQALDETLARLRAALLILHAPLDSYVGVENATSIFLKAKHPKSYHSLDQADHLLTKPADAEFVGETIATWAKRYLPLADPPATPSDSQVFVSETGVGKFQNLVTSAHHSMIADEPKSYGGLDSGPGPYDFLMAGLGACTSMTIRMYAERKGWPLEGVSVALDHAKVHANDCESCETTTGKIDQITKRIELEGPQLSAEQRQRLLEIADKCPVHRTLHAEVEVLTTLAEG